MIEVLSSGMPNVIQDLGRVSYLKIGVSRSGAMDSFALSAANFLVSNVPTAAGIEIGLFPFKLRFKTDVRFACTGADVITSLDGRRLPPWWSVLAAAGQTLEIGAPSRGVRAYLAFAGGIDVPVVLGSRSTDLKSGFGGLDGRGLRRGDVLQLLPSLKTLDQKESIGLLPQGLPVFWQALATGCIKIRVMVGAEYHCFTEQARTAFVNSEYEVTRDCNRMGYRLSGAALELRQPLELLSHGIVPGTVQVPPSGQPIIQLAEANTCGGYPKIGNVIDIDLWRLAQARPGTRLRFDVIDAASALTQTRLEIDNSDVLKHIYRPRAQV